MSHPHRFVRQPSFLSSSLSSLSWLPQYQDTVLVCRDSTFRASRLLLALAFPTMDSFLRPRGEDEAVVLLPDYDSEEVTGYLRVFLENTQENSEENREKSEENIEDNIEENSEKNSEDNIEEKNVSDVQEIQDYFVENKPMHFAENYLGEKPKEVISTFNEGKEFVPTFDQVLGVREKEARDVTRIPTNIDKSLVCKLCQASCSNSGNMNTHMAAKHGIDRTFKCRWCRAHFRSKYDMKNHQKRYCEGEQYKCPEVDCKSTFKITSKVAFQDHLNRHWGRFDYKCDECGKVFAVKEWYVTHKNNHLEINDPNIPPLTCHICSKRCKNKQRLLMHVQTHNEPDKVKCNVCGKGFVCDSKMRYHMVCHTKEKNYSCSDCGQAFLRRQQVDLHVRRVHTGIRNYKCETCGKAFVESQHLKRHVRIHTGLMPFGCSKCGKLHNQSANRNKHELNCHRS